MKKFQQIYKKIIKQQIVGYKPQYEKYDGNKYDIDRKFPMIAIHWQNIDGMLHFKLIKYIPDNKTLQEIIEDFEGWATSNMNLDVKSAVNHEKNKLYYGSKNDLYEEIQFITGENNTFQIQYNPQ